MKPNIQLMVNAENIKVLADLKPRALKRVLNIIQETFSADYATLERFEECWKEIERREIRRFPSPAQLQVMSNLSHIKGLMKHHYKYLLNNK